MIEEESKIHVTDQCLATGHFTLWIYNVHYCTHRKWESSIHADLLLLADDVKPSLIAPL